MEIIAYIVAIAISYFMDPLVGRFLDKASENIELINPDGIDKEKWEPMFGQRLTIRIIGSKWMPVQRTNKYRYEVMSRNSTYHRNVDFMHSTELLRPGHTYRVRFNQDNGNPGILKVFKEVELPKKVKKRKKK